MRIADREIARGEPVFISVELGVTPNGNLKRALELIDACAHAGADAAKFIVTDVDKIMSARDVPFTYETMDGPRTRPIYDLLKETQFTFDEWVTIPMAGRSESLNVGMAAAVLCFEAARQLRPQGS